MKVTVVTSTIGRPELRQAISSVKGQTHPCLHYVFINGSQYSVDYFPHDPTVKIIGLPRETGVTGADNAGVFAAAGFLTDSDIICYLNDDDFFAPDHVERLVKLITENNLNWAYSLRRFVDLTGDPICDDDFDSLGFWPCEWDSSQYLVDCSCYAVRRSVATQLGHAWYHPITGDRNFLHVLKALGGPYGCTGKVTVNYRVGLGTASSDLSYYRNNTALSRTNHPGGFPWRRPAIFREGKCEYL